MSELFSPVKSTVTVRAPAKINLRLGVGPVRDDGYHPLETVYQAIGLYDDVTVCDAELWEIEVDSPSGLDLSDVPRDESNLVVRAGRLLQQHHGLTEAAARVEIAKGIPVAGGLAGGSADAAATLVALDRLWDLETTDDDLLAIAARLGSDVPFALLGGSALGRGRGELVDPVTDTGDWWWVLVPDPAGLSTPAVYARFDDLPAPDPLPLEPLLEALVSGDVDDLGAALVNDLEPAAQQLHPRLVETCRAIDATTAVSRLLSGSGPTMLALARDADHAREIREQLAEQGIEQTWAAPGPVAGTHLVNYA